MLTRPDHRPCFYIPANTIALKNVNASCAISAVSAISCAVFSANASAASFATDIASSIAVFVAVNAAARKMGGMVVVIVVVLNCLKYKPIQVLRASNYLMALLFITFIGQKKWPNYNSRPFTLINFTYYTA